MLKVAISFDYDTPIGYRESFNIKDISEYAEIEGAEEIITILKKFDIKATFGVVAKILDDDKYKEVFYKQIIQINELGHEVCSHSYSHKFLPSLTMDQLIDEIRLGKKVIEECVKTKVIGFIPPFNRPMNFPQKGAFSISEILGLHGRGRGKHNLGNVLKILEQNGYKWSRVSYESKINQVRKLFSSKIQGIIQPFSYNSLVVIPVHSTGFGVNTCKLIKSYLGENVIISIYAHPHQAFNQDNCQNTVNMQKMIEMFEDKRYKGLLKYIKMNEVINYI